VVTDPIGSRLKPFPTNVEVAPDGAQRSFFVGATSS